MDKGVGGRNARSRLGQPESPAQHSGSDDDGDMADHTRDLSSASSALQGLLKKASCLSIFIHLISN